MGKVLSFKKPEKASQDLASLSPEAHRAELKRYCASVNFPAEQRIDTEFGIATIDKEGHDHLKKMFMFFGVTDLDPSGDDFETVVNTWFVLNAYIGEDISARELFYDTVYVIDVADYLPEYVAYFDALWNGDRAGVLTGAKALNIVKGIPEDAPSLRKSPISQKGVVFISPP